MHIPARARLVMGVAAAPVALGALVVFGVWPRTGQAAEWPLAGGKLNASGSIYFGTVQRTSERDPEIVTAANATLLGVAGTAAAGKNQDDGNLNFAKGDAVSTAVKGSLELGWRRDGFGVMARFRAWHDKALLDDARPWGNTPNGLTAGQPLSDAGFARRARFEGALADDVHLFGRTALGSASLDWKLGTFKPDWGTRFSFSGGLSDLTPRDFAAQRRAGALPEEGTIAVPGAAATLRLNAATQLDAFVQVGLRPNVALGCGTFFAAVDFVAEGCNKALLGAANDRTSLANGVFVKRATNVMPSDSGQAGIGVRHALPALGLEVGLHAAQFHSRAAYFGSIKTLRAAGAPFLPGDPGGLNPQYFIEYPPSIRMLALTLEKKLAAGVVLAELSYRPNQPFQYNAIDLLNAFGSATAATPLRAAANALPLGAVFSGYERHKAWQLNLAVQHGLPRMLGAAGGSVGAELVAKYVIDLPDPAQMRFRRSDVYGSAPLAGVACPPTASAKSCSLDGYVSANAVAVRMRLGLRYPQVFGGVDLLPSLALGQDLQGWSEDGTISEGRRVAVLSLRAEVAKAWLAEIAWQPTWGGGYNNQKDRDTLSMSVGYRF